MTRKLAIAVSLVALLGLLASGAWAEERLSYVSGTKADSGNNTLISAPGSGNQIVLYLVQIQNESATSTVVKLLDGSTQFYRAKLTAVGSGLVLDLQKDGRSLRLSPNAALVLNLDGANSHNFTVWYTVERMR